MGSLAEMFKSDSLKLRQSASRALGEVATAQLASIQRRLDRGIGSSGSPFVPYAASTAARKGRTAPVTLLESGNMRSSMYVRRIRLDWYEIAFSNRDAERIARFQHGGTRRATVRDVQQRQAIRRRGTRHIHRNTGQYHVPPRPFLSPTDAEIRDADRRLGVIVSAQFPGDLRRRIVIRYRV